MDKINELIQWIGEVELAQIINIIIAIVVVIFTVILSPFISLGIAKIFNWKKKRKEIKKGALFNILKSFIIISGVFLATKVLGLNQELNIFIIMIYNI